MTKPIKAKKGPMKRGRKSRLLAKPKSEDKLRKIGKRRRKIGKRKWR